MHGPTDRMTRTPLAAGEAMLRKLQLHTSFTKTERQVLLALPMNHAYFAARDTIVHEGDALTRSCVLVDGFAARFKTLPDGSRQILSLHTAGDMMDLHSMVLEVADHGIAALSHVRVTYLTHAALLDASDRYPVIARALWRETLIDGSVFREWLLNIGRRDAYSRMAHLICEMKVKMEAIRLAREDGFPFPVTQAELADATGLTTVHVNRTMQRLRRDGLISTRGTDVLVEDWDALVDAAAFDPTYLHLRNH